MKSEADHSQYSILGFKSPDFFRRFKRRNRGIALIMVTGSIAILAILVVGILALADTERESAEAFAEGVEVRNLAEVPVNLAIGQLRMATETNGTQRTWASQPGAIRVFGTSTDDITGRARLEKVYKLYSAEKMVAEGTDFDPEDELPPEDWADNPGLYTDLNEPVAVDLEGDGRPRNEYPILSGNAHFSDIEGFELERVAGITANGRGVAPRMPTRWLYVLEDGSVISPVEQNGDEVTFGSDGPTTGNGIVGRVAFWADDETSKVNINTASEGSFWDMPRANTHWDAYNYADKQPVKNEFQRYPGHPAVTSLSTVLGGYIGDDSETYYSLSPYVANGGSNGGTRNVDQNTDPVELDDDRLYATVDEYIFKSADMANKVRVRNHKDGAASTPLFTRETLDQTKFFLTANSRAPEVNLFNKPRISLWPVQQDSMDRNAVDRVMAFCSQTRNGSSVLPYYFQRLSAHDMTVPLAGYGSSQSPTADMQIERNQQLYTYLLKLMENSIPGFGKTFLEKYPRDRNQIATQMVDYLRSGLNTMATGLETPRNSFGYFYAPPHKITGLADATFGEGQVIPLEIGDTRGFGRSVTVTEAALIIYPVEYDENETKTVNVPGANNVEVFKADKVRAFLLLEFFTPSPGLPPWSPYINIEVDGLQNFTLGGNNLRMPPAAKVLVHTPIETIPGDNGRFTGPGGSCAHMSLFQPLFQNNGQPRDFDSVDQNTGFAWHSTSPVSIDKNQEHLSLGGGDLTITIRNYNDSEVVQTVNMTFPSTTVPAPYVWCHPNLVSGDPPRPNAHDFETDLSLRVREAVRDYDTYLIRPGDVVRSVEADVNALPKGDFRFYSAYKDVPSSWFTKGGKPGEYDNQDSRFALGLRNGNFWQYWGHFRTRTSPEPGDDAIDRTGLVPGNEVNPYRRDSSNTVAGNLIAQIGKTPADGKPFHGYRDYHPVCARGMEYAARYDGRPGDWDNGFGNNEDGPYINKTDESNASKRYWNWGGAQHSGGYFRRGNFDSDNTGINHSPNRQIASPVMMGSLPSGIKSGQPWQTLLFCPNPAGRTTLPSQNPTPADHYGFTFPRDHLLLDFFWMPVAEPYAISEPFSTGGKVNLNYDILPFRYIKRRTAVHAVLNSIHPYCAHPRAAQRTGLGCFKGGRDQHHKQELRYDINLDHESGTLLGFERRFNDEGDIFRSASELCEIFIVPKKKTVASMPYPPEATTDPTYDSMNQWWNTFLLTADNVREMPYNHALPRLTTKSNTFTVHYRVQYLKKVRSTSPDVFVVDKDQVVAEHRGSSLIERYIDPNDPNLPDFASGDFTDVSLDPFYRIRVVRKKQFAP